MKQKNWLLVAPPVTCVVSKLSKYTIYNKKFCSFSPESGHVSHNSGGLLIIIIALWSGHLQFLLFAFQNLLAFLDKAEKRFEKMGPLGADIEAVKKQIDQLKIFKAEVDPHMVKVEALNRLVILFPVSISSFYQIINFNF